MGAEPTYSKWFFKDFENRFDDYSNSGLFDTQTKPAFINKSMDSDMGTQDEGTINLLKTKKDTWSITNFIM